MLADEEHTCSATERVFALLTGAYEPSPYLPASEPGCSHESLGPFMLAACEPVLSRARVDSRLPEHGTANSARRILDLAPQGDLNAIRAVRTRASINTTTRRGRANFNALDACLLAATTAIGPRAVERRTAILDDFASLALSAVRGYTVLWGRQSALDAFRAEVTRSYESVAPTNEEAISVG